MIKITKSSITLLFTVAEAGAPDYMDLFLIFPG